MAHFDLIAHRYDSMRKPPIDEFFAFAKPSKTDRVLDVGGGTGVVAARLNSLVRAVYVLDVSTAMLAKAKARKVTTFVGTVEKLPFAAKTFDLIICMGTFHHVQNQEKALLEMRRVLKHKGRIVFEEFNALSSEGKFGGFIKWLARFNTKFHTSHELTRLLHQCGFKTTVREHNTSYFVKATLQ